MRDIKVGDRVALPDRNVCARVESIDQVGIRCGDVGGVYYCHASRLTVIPTEPKPTYRVEYDNDQLHLVTHTIVDGGDLIKVFGWQLMDDPAAVEQVIIAWGNEFDIDVDEVRRMIAEPHVIETTKPAKLITCVALRHATGWFARINAIGTSDTAVRNGEHLSEDAGRGHFRDIKGPYVELPDEPA